MGEERGWLWRIPVPLRRHDGSGDGSLLLRDREGSSGNGDLGDEGAEAGDDVVEGQDGEEGEEEEEERAAEGRAVFAVGSQLHLLDLEVGLLEGLRQLISL